MELLNADTARVQAKLNSVSEKERGMLRRTVSGATDNGLAPVPKLTDNMTPSIIAGFVHGVIVMMSFGSFAIVIFGQSEHLELRQALAIGISQQFLSACVLIGLLTFKGFFPFTMGGPTPPSALLIADVVQAVVNNVEDSDKKVPTAIVTIALVSILMGLMLVLISVTKTSVYALQLPFPVLCGFLGSVGVLLMRNSFSILLNTKLKWTFIPADWNKFIALDPVGAVLQVALGVAVAALLLQIVPRVKAKASARTKVWVLPTLFVIPLVAFYASVLGGDIDMGVTSELRSMNPPWLSKTSEWSWSPKDFFAAYVNVTKWDLGAIFSGEAILRMVISSFLCVIAALINMAGIETNAPQKTSLDLDKEFMSLGGANLVVGLLGGHPGHHVAAFTLPMKKDGGTTKVSPWTASIIWFLAFITAAPLSAIIPRFFFGGCFLQVGFGLARTFLWDNRKGMDRVSICIALLTVLVAVFTDLNIASGVGFLLVACNFVRLSMDGNVVRAVERADLKRAPRYRTSKELAVLELQGHRVMVLYLQGYLFWGIVDEVTSAFDELIDGTEDDPDTIFVDMRYVIGIELSVVNTFKKLQRLAKNVGIEIKLCSLPSKDIIGPGLYQQLALLPFASTKDLCSLIEDAEDVILESWRTNSPEKQYAYEDKGVTQAEEAQLLRSAKKQQHLAQMVESNQCIFGIRWEEIDGKLHPNQTYFPVWRAEKLVRKNLETKKKVRTYATESTKLTFFASGAKDSSAVGTLARSHMTKKAMLCDNINQLPDGVFLRKDLAQEFGINKIIFIPTPDGSVIELGALGSKDGTVDVSTFTTLTEDIVNLCNTEEPHFLKQVFSTESVAKIPDMSHILAKSMSWNLALAIMVLGELKALTKDDPILENPNASLVSMKKDGVAEEVFVILEGSFGTYRKDPLTEELGLILKSPAGTLIGADDVWAYRPRSVQLRCVSEEGVVVALNRKAVKAIEICSTPFVSARESEEFIDFMKREMSLSMSIMERTFLH